MQLVFSAIIDTIKTKKSEKDGNTTAITFDDLDEIVVNSDENSGSMMAKLLELFEKDSVVYITVSTERPETMYKQENNMVTPVFEKPAAQVVKNRKQEDQNAISTRKPAWKRTTPS